MADIPWQIIVLQASTLGALIFNAWMSERRALRERRWSVEDREAQMVKTAIDAATAAETTRDQVQTLADQVAQADAKATQARRTLQLALDKNTHLTQQVQVDAKKAYSEANDVNRKIESLGIAINASNQTPT